MAFELYKADVNVHLEMAAGHTLGRAPSQASPQSLLMHSRASSNSSGSNVPTYSAASANDSGTEAGRSSFSRRQAVCHSRPPRTSRSSLQYISEIILRALNIYTEKWTCWTPWSFRLYH